MTSRLVEKGVAVTTSEAGNPLVLNYDSQVVSFRDREGLHPLPGDFTLMKGISYLIYRVGDLWTAPAWAILPLSEYQENYFPDGTNSEAIVNVTINDGAKVVYSGSRMYYINDGEKSHYSGAALPFAPHTKNYKAVDQ
ncbi:hypothetical protein [Methylogaea oryzae]|uniref:hypothetical protein n=1 Tax=Methylogaea oryzae TaxID=1295382 RepID=UPI0006D1C0F1|nr:hypothetical protein [Methylogaea oryzae]